MESALRERGGAGTRLIETMLWDGHAVPRLPLHMARLAAGARTLGYAFDPTALVLTGPDAPARLRLTLGAAGDLVLETAPLPPFIAKWRLGLAVERLVSGDPWLRVKSTHRPAYDAARAALPARLDEVVLLNERGEVCDGTITSVFFDRGQGLRTPPLSCGVLPGVLRAELAVPEEVLQAGDLPHVSLMVGNALRGLCPAVWAG